MITKDIRFVIVREPGTARDAGMMGAEAGPTEREIAGFASADPVVAGGPLTVEVRGWIAGGSRARMAGCASNH